MWAFVRRHLLTAYAVLAFAYLLVPIAVVVAFSFNDPTGRFNYTWQGFTLNNWVNWDAVPGAARRAQALARDRRAREHLRDRARDADRARPRPLPLPRPGGDEPPHLPPDVDAGDRARRVAALALPDLHFPLGFWTILIAHVMFNISYVVVTVKARLVGFDRHLEEAAMDLGANEWATFTQVTLPLIAPAILSGLLLTFALSVDDFVITNFNAGTAVTFPLFVWGAARVGGAAADQRDRDGDLRGRRDVHARERPLGQPARRQKLAARMPGVTELTPAEIAALLEEQLVGRIGCHVDGLTYVVPVVYAYDSGSVYVLSTEGQKVDMMRANPAGVLRGRPLRRPRELAQRRRAGALRGARRRGDRTGPGAARRAGRPAPWRGEGAVAAAVRPGGRGVPDPPRRRHGPRHLPLLRVRAAALGGEGGAPPGASGAQCGSPRRPRRACPRRAEGPRDRRGHGAGRVRRSA